MGQHVELDSNKNILVKLSGEVTTQDVETTTIEVTKLADSLETIKVIMDVSDLKKVPPRAREAMTKNPMPKSEKIAVVGASPMVRVLGSLVLKVTPNVKLSRFFDTMEEALKWLHEEE